MTIEATDLRSRFVRWFEPRSSQLFLLPVLLVFVVLILIPLSQSIWYSFTDYSGISRVTKFVGFKNYIRAFTDSAMIAGLSYTFIYAIATTILVTLLAIPLAVALNTKFLGRNFVRGVVFFPAIPSIAILGLVWAFILSPLPSGAINALTNGLFGLPAVGWLVDPTLARICTIVVSVWVQTGWHSILYLAYLQSIPSDLYEAATVDGATGPQRFLSITVPLLVPAISVSTVLLLTGGLKVFDLPFTLTKGGPGYATTTVTQAIISRGLAQAKFGEASALAVIFMLFVAAVIVLQVVVARRIERRFQL